MVLREVVEGQAGLPVPNSTHSYWHKDPSKKLLGYRSTPDLPAEADTVIIGTGMTGSFAARFLKEPASPASQQSLLVLEAREACWGATGRNGGHCQPFLYGANEDVARFELETYGYLSDLVRDEGVKCDWRPVNGVHAMLSQDVFDAAAKAIPALRRKIPDFADKIAVVSPRGMVDGPGEGEDGEWARGLTLETLRLDRPGVAGAIVQKHAASMWPYKLVCHVLEKLLAEHGPESFNLQTNTPVTGVSRDATRPGRWVVATPRGRVSAKKVLLATNGYTSRLLPAFSDLIVPVRGQIGALLPPEPRVALDYSYVFFGQLKGDDGQDTTRDEYLVQRPLPRGELILGGGRHLAKEMAVGEWRDDTVEPRVAKWLRTELEPVLSLDRKEDKVPQEGLEASMEWTGIMAYSRDQAPWIGAVPESLGGGEGLYIASGFTGHGMPRCALAGRGIARIMLGDTEGHGLPKTFVVHEERAAKARENWGRVGTVDEMETLIADLKPLIE